MKNRINYISLAALTVIGDAFLCLKFSGNLANDLVALVLATLVTVLLALALNYAFIRFKRIKANLYLPLAILGILALITTAVFTLKSFSFYAAKTMLQANDIFLPFVTLAALSLFLAVSGKKVMSKLATLVLPIALGIILFVFAFSVQFMSVKYFIPYRIPSGGMLKAFCPLVLSLAPSVLPIILLSKGKGVKSIASALTVGIGGVAIGMLNVLGIFGSEFAATLSYPYSVSVGTASMGEIFSRLDGFFYALIFFTTLIKVGICIYCTKTLISSLILKISAKNF